MYQVEVELTIIPVTKLKGARAWRRKGEGRGGGSARGGERVYTAI